MGGQIEVAQEAGRVTPGDQDFISADWDPNNPVVGGMFVITRAVTNGTPRVNAILGRGAFSLTTQWATATFSRNGISPNNPQSFAKDEACLLLTNRTGGINARAAFKEVLPQGVRVTWSVAHSGGLLVKLILFGGSDCLFHADFLQSLLDEDGKKEITEAGFPPEVLWVSSVARKPNLLLENDYRSLEGFCDLLTLEQRSINQSEASPSVDGDPGTWVSTDRVARLSHPVSGGIESIEVTKRLASGFEVTTREEDGIVALTYACWSFHGTVKHKMGTILSPNPGGNVEHEDPGFKPQAVVHLCSMVDEADVLSVADTAGSVGIGAFTPDDSWTAACSIEDASNPTDTQCLVDNSPAAILIPDGDGTNGLAAEYVAMIPLGYELNWTLIKVVPRILIYLAFGQFVAPGGAVGRGDTVRIEAKGHTPEFDGPSNTVRVEAVGRTSEIGPGSGGVENPNATELYIDYEGLAVPNNVSATWYESAAHVVPIDDSSRFTFPGKGSAHISGESIILTERQWLCIMFCVVTVTDAVGQMDLEWRMTSEIDGPAQVLRLLGIPSTKQAPSNLRGDHYEDYKPFIVDATSSPQHVQFRVRNSQAADGGGFTSVNCILHCKALGMRTVAIIQFAEQDPIHEANPSATIFQANAARITPNAFGAGSTLYSGQGTVTIDVANKEVDVSVGRWAGFIFRRGTNKHAANRLDLRDAVTDSLDTASQTVYIEGSGEDLPGPSVEAEDHSPDGKPIPGIIGPVSLCYRAGHENSAAANNAGKMFVTYMVLEFWGPV